MLEKACAANPQSAELPYSLGNMLLQAGRAAEAETQFRRSLAIAPDSPDAIANLGAALRINGRYAEAVGYLRRAIELLPGSISPLANLGSILVFMNDYAAAEEIFKRALRINPKDQEQRPRAASTPRASCSPPDFPTTSISPASRIPHPATRSGRACPS